MSDDERYNGWTNRETWALNLWLSNDQGLYEMVNERVREARNEYTDGFEEEDGLKLNDVLPGVVGEAIKELWDELTDPDEQLMSCEEILKMVRDIGSEYRVDWSEIGGNWLSDLGDE